MMYDENLLFRVFSLELKSLKGRKTKYHVISGQVELEVTWLPLSPVPPSSSPVLPLTSLPRVILSVFLFSANNLGHYVSKGGAAVPVPVGYLPSARVSRGQGSKASSSYCLFMILGDCQNWQRGNMEK